MRILVVDVGGPHVKVLATGHPTPIKIPSGPDMTPAAMVRKAFGCSVKLVNDAAMQASGSYEEYVGKAGLKRLGKKKWRRTVVDVLKRLKTALEVNDVVVGGYRLWKAHVRR